MPKQYVSSKVACKRIGVSNKTLVAWAKADKIDYILTEGGWRKYNVDKYMADKGIIPRVKICYCRVSSHDQKEDLERQVSYMRKKYPGHQVIQDIGSGINFKRKGIKQLIDLAVKGELDEVVVTYRDRLCRIGYDLLEHMFSTYSRAKITVVNQEDTSIQENITNDLIEIITVYSAKIYGSRGKK